MSQQQENTQRIVPLLQVLNKKARLALFADTWKTGAFNAFAEANNLTINEDYTPENKDESIQIIEFATAELIFLTEPYVSWFKQGQDDKFPDYYRGYEAGTKSNTHILCLLVGGTDKKGNKFNIEPLACELCVKASNSKFFLFDSFKSKEKDTDKIGCGFADFMREIIKDGHVHSYVAEIGFSKNKVKVGGDGASTSIFKLQFNLQNCTPRTIPNKVIGQFAPIVYSFKDLMIEQQRNREEQIKQRERDSETWQARFLDELKQADLPKLNKLYSEWIDIKKALADHARQYRWVYDADKKAFVHTED